MSQESNHYVRRIVLPSGKTIEVVYFEDLPVDKAAVPADIDEHIEDLSVCGTCRSQLVYPVDWHEAGTRHWEVTLRCPNCEWVGTGIFEQAVVDRYDLELDRATRDLAGDLARLEKADAISPRDFQA
jgi:hypothetical protein